MKKKTLFALLLAAVMLLSGCSLVLKDSAVDAKQTIIDVNGEQVDKQTFLNAYNYTLTMQQYYAQMLQQFGGDGTVDRTVRGKGVVSKNALCPCGSGKKYKRCCGKDLAD